MIEGVTHPGEEYDILATGAPIDDRTRVLKHDDTFAVFDRFGDIDITGSGELGLYHKDTRFLSRLKLRIESERPLMLDSSVSEDDAFLRVDMMNADVRRGDEVVIPHGTVHLSRSKVVWQGACHEQLCFHSYSLFPVEIALSIEFEADFADLFEVRGMPRARRGHLFPPATDGASLVLAYEGLDGYTRRTRVTLDRVPEWRSGSVAMLWIRLEPHERETVHVSMACEIGEPRGSREGSAAPVYERVVEKVRAARYEAKVAEPNLSTSNNLFDKWLGRSIADIHMLRTNTRHGPYPYAGVPWFSTAFGRDGIIAALECLWFDPGLARGVLSYLAQTQALSENAEEDSQPGKILHETRAGEMAALGEVPFGRYYGSVDATPLFLMLAGAYHARTGDLEFIRSLWPQLSRAMEWIDRDGDPDGDGFYEYRRRSHTGLLHQGWKDSHDPVFHADGTLAEGPIALCEVQAYVYAAKLAAGKLSRELGLEDRALILESEAHALQERFEDAFWCEDLSIYALALDGEKRPCRVITSNAGHCLYAGIATEEHARRVAQTLMREDSFSGWGIRTVSSSERRYNPMSYHNGSVWPHDNALIAAGFARYGIRQAAEVLLSSLFDSSIYFDSHRLPELFCGFPRQSDEGPTFYPVACSPQAWAAGSVFLCMQACLGLEVSASDASVSLSSPLLPTAIDWMGIRGLQVGDATVDLMLTRHLGDVTVGVQGRTGDVRVVTVK